MNRQNFIKIKHPDGSYGVTTQEPLTEEQADTLIKTLRMILEGVF